MRTVGFLVFLCLGASLGCKGKADADATPDPAALKAQQDLLARRDKLVQTRQKLASDVDSLAIEITDIEAHGGNAADKKKQKADLEKQLNNTSTTDELNQLNSKLDQMKQTGDKTAQVASREAELASREKQLADREAKVGQREHELFQRDAELAARWKDTCSSGAPVIIQQSAKGGNYTKKDVSDLIAKAKQGMSKKGILVGDLPGPSQGLETEAGKAMNDNDMSKAYFAAAQLAGIIDSIQVNRPFIQAKMARVQAQIKSSKPDDATNQQLSNILSDVIQKFGDGDFNAANKRLNQLVAMLK